MPGWWRRICRPIVRPALSPNDTPEDTERKWIFIPVIVSTLTISWLFRLMRAFVRGGFKYSVLGSFVNVAVLIYTYKTKRLTQAMVEWCMLYFCIYSIIHGDMRNRGKYDHWALSVVLMDILLLTRSQGIASRLVRYAVLVYLALKSIEEVESFGLYTAVVETDDSDRECKPLKSSEAAALFLSRAFGFLTDFNLTSKFANGMYSEQERMRGVIRTAEEIAADLVRFDLDSAEKTLQSGCDEGPLKEALRSLLENLRCYRPYLPDMLFAGDTGNIISNRSPPQGDRVAMVFTDIQSSTLLWETCHEGMKEALELHNRILRGCIAQRNGYEVKTIGDSFMVAFDTVEEAVGFCIDAQRGLLEAEWPEELLDVLLCSPDEDGPWCGLRVRMGVHFGEAETQMNPVTGRADYFGPTVNVAARVEGIAKGGTIFVTQKVAQVVSKSAEVDAKVESIGKRALRGLTEEVSVWLLIPHGMEGRVLDDADYVLDCKNRRSKPSSLNQPNSPRTSRYSETILRPNHELHTLRPKLSRQVATVGTVRVEYPFHPTDAACTVNDVLTTIIGSLERTEGAVVSLLSTMVLVGWNAGRPCTNHAVQALQFAALMSKVRLVAPWGESATIGQCTGPILHGNVGNERQRFVTVQGQCVDVSVWIAGCAADLPTFALTASIPGYPGVVDEPTLCRLVRKADEIMVQGSPLAVYEVNCVAAATKNTETEEWGWSDECRLAIASNDWGRLQCDDDLGLLRIALLREKNSHLRCEMPVNKLTDGLD